jgi:hypothetical protein
MSKAQEDIDARLEAIAREHLGIETLAQRNADSLDFCEVAIWTLRSALLEAYREGCRDETPSSARRSGRARPRADAQSK